MDVTGGGLDTEAERWLRIEDPDMQPVFARREMDKDGGSTFSAMEGRNHRSTAVVVGEEFSVEPSGCAAVRRDKEPAMEFLGNLQAGNEVERHRGRLTKGFQADKGRWKANWRLGTIAVQRGSKLNGKILNRVGRVDDPVLFGG